WMRPYVSSVDPALELMMATGSRAGGRAARDSGTKRPTAIRARSVTGTLMRKTQPHQRFVNIHPPRIGPIGRARKIAAAGTPIARGRRPWSKRTVMTERDVVMSPAAPRPSATRATMSAAGEGAYAHAAEAAPKVTREARRSALRP